LRVWESAKRRKKAGEAKRTRVAVLKARNKTRLTNDEGKKGTAIKQTKKTGSER